MTDTRTPALPVDRLAGSELLGYAAGAGLALGVVDLLLQLGLPYPLADLANSSAVWALAAFAGAWCLVGRVPAATGLVAAAGAVLLVVATETYYLAAFAGGRADLWMLLAPSTLTWAFFGVVAGAGAAAAGVWARRATGWRAGAGLCVALALPLAEAGVRLGAASAYGELATVVLYLGLTGVVLAVFGRRPGVTARALLLLPFAVVAALLAFHTAGF